MLKLKIKRLHFSFLTVFSPARGINIPLRSEENGFCIEMRQLPFLLLFAVTLRTHRTVRAAAATGGFPLFFILYHFDNNQNNNENENQTNDNCRKVL